MTDALPEEISVEDPQKDEKEEENLAGDHSNVVEKDLEHGKEEDRPTTPIDEEKKKEILESKRAGKFVQKKTKSKLFENHDHFSKLEKYRELDRNHPLNRPFQGDASFRGPICKIIELYKSQIVKRKRTDILWIFIFIVFNIGFFAYGVIVFKDGIVNRLTNGNDFRAEICGVDLLSNKPFLYFPSATVDINVAFCVKSCPTTSGQPICMYDTNGQTETTFCYTQVESKPYGKYCLPQEPLNKAAVDSYLDEIQNVIKRIAGDLATSLDVMSIGLIITLIIAVSIFINLKKPERIKYAVWISIWGSFVALGLLAYFCYDEYSREIAARCIQDTDKHNCGGSRAYFFKIGIWICLAVAGVYMLIFAKIFNKVNLGIGILESVAKCTHVMHQIRHLPWYFTAFAVAISAFFISIIVRGFSIGSITTIQAENIDGGYVKIIVYDPTYRVLTVFEVLVFQWWLGTILLFSDTIIAYSMSIWFFEKRKETVTLPVDTTVKTIWKYHLGTIIMLSLFKFIFKIPAWFMGTVKDILMAMKQEHTFVRFFQACCLCCIHLYERFFRYLSKHTLVQMCMWSANFLTAGKRAYFLQLRHSKKIKNMDFLSTFLLFQAKIFSALFGCIFTYFYLKFIPVSPIGTDLTEVETPLVPALMVFYFGFYFSSVFLNSFNIASKTILQCYLMDCEMFVGDQRYVENFIRDFMEFYKRSLDVDDDKYAETQQMVQGFKATNKFVVEERPEEDPDVEENKKFEREVASSSSDEDKAGDEEEKEEKEEEDSGSEYESDEDIPTNVFARNLEMAKVRINTPDSIHHELGGITSRTDDLEETKIDRSTDALFKPKTMTSGADRLQLNKKMVEKNSSSNNKVTGDQQSIFNNSSRLGNSKLGVDDDDEGGMRYRLQLILLKKLQLQYLCSFLVFQT